MKLEYRIIDGVNQVVTIDNQEIIQPISVEIIDNEIKALKESASQIDQRIEQLSSLRVEVEALEAKQKA